MSTDPSFLDIETIFDLHDMQINAHGGDPGIGDLGLLESALAAPQNVYLYGGGSLFDLAASYAFHLTKNHAFVDGNKRIALAAALTFLAENGWTVYLENNRLYEAMIQLSSGGMDEERFAKLLREASSKAEV